MLSVVFVSFNRREALRASLERTLALLAGEPHEAIVVDNQSGDGSAAMVRESFPGVRVEALAENVGVRAFNVGVGLARGDEVLVLDDDAWPDGASLKAARAAMARDARVGGVALVPVHPSNGVREWPQVEGAMERCPVMGCGNLVRREAWARAGGYEEAFFLYRNDADLALKLLGSGWKVLARPEWIVWHDSPAASEKGERWLELATRNWCWMVRRHARGWTGWRAAALGTGWACVKAGLDPDRLACVARGAWAGLASSPPPLPRGVEADGQGVRALVRLQLCARRGRESGRGDVGRELAEE